MISIVLGFVIYAQIVHFDYALDDHLVSQEMAPTSWSIDHIKHIFSSNYNETDYRPVTILSFYIEKIAAGENTPALSHKVNLALYLIIAMQLFFFGLSLCRKLDASYFICFAAGLIFVAHPIHTEVVANIKSRDNLLSLFFSLVSLQTLLLALNRKQIVQPIFLLFSLLFFSIALLSKLDAYFLIFIVPLTIIFLSPKEKIQASRYFLLFLLSYYFTRSFLFPDVNSEEVVSGFVRYTENPIVIGNHLLKSIGVASQTFWIYLLKFIIPSGYYLYYGFDQIQIIPLLSIKGLLLFILSMLTLIYTLFILKNRWVKYSILFLFFSLLYCLNLFVIVAGIIAMRYAFIASIGFCFLTASIIHFYIPGNRIFKWVFLSIIVLGFSISSKEHTKKWESNKRLIETDIPYLNRSHEGQRIAGQTYLAIGDTVHDMSEQKKYYEKALTHIVRANEIFAQNVVTIEIEGRLHYKLGDLDNALINYQKALNIDSTNSVLYEIKGDIYYLKELPTESIRAYNNAFRLSQDQAFLSKISTVYFTYEDADKVRLFNRQLIEKHPKFYVPYENISYLELIEGDTLEAIYHIQKATELGCRDPHLMSILNSRK